MSTPSLLEDVVGTHETPWSVHWTRVRRFHPAARTMHCIRERMLDLHSEHRSRLQDSWRQVSSAGMDEFGGASNGRGMSSPLQSSHSGAPHAPLGLLDVGEFVCLRLGQQSQRRHWMFHKPHRPESELSAEEVLLHRLGRFLRHRAVYLEKAILLWLVERAIAAMQQ